MSTIIIDGSERAIQAGSWANNNIKHKWQLELLNPFANNPRYAFNFSNSQDASFFALKWKQ